MRTRIFITVSEGECLRDEGLVREEGKGGEGRGGEGS